MASVDSEPKNCWLCWLSYRTDVIDDEINGDANGRNVSIILLFRKCLLVVFLFGNIYKVCLMLLHQYGCQPSVNFETVREDNANFGTSVVHEEAVS